MVSGDTAIVRRITMVGEVSNVQIGDDNGMEIFGGKFRNHTGKIRKASAIDRKRPVLFLEIDVEKNHIGRNMVRSQPVGNFKHSRLRGVAVTRLLITESPNRRKRAGASQPCIGLHYLFRRGSIKE